MDGEISTSHKRFLAPADFATRPFIDSSRRLVLATSYYSVTSELIVHLVPADLSIHREDGSMPRFLTASLFNVSQDQRENEGGE